MAQQVLGTFQSREAADAVKDAFIKEGFAPHDLIVMSNRQASEPPEDAQLEVGREGEPGFAGLEEKIGKSVLRILGKDKESSIDGDGFEGEGKQGALLAVTLEDLTQESRVRALLERHFAADIELSQPH